MKWLEDIKNYIKKIQRWFIKEDLMVMALFFFGMFVLKKKEEIRYPSATLGTFLGYLSKNIITNVV